MTEAEMVALLRWFADQDLCEELSWRSTADSVRFLVRCNDMFWWATADCEQVTAADIPELQRAYDDLVDDACSEVFSPQLWVARKRQMRPQRPWGKDLLPAARAIFDDAGPERDPKDEG